MLWRTEQTVKLIELTLRDIKGVNVSYTECGGDYDTQTVMVIVRDEGTLWIRGFRTDEPLAKQDMVDVQMVEVTDGRCSSSGLNSSGKDICVGYGLICHALRTAGHTVVQSMDGHF